MSIRGLIAGSGLRPEQKFMAQILRLNESPMGLSHTIATQHLLMSWVPKAVFSRSAAELTELSILEIVEPLLVYYSIPLTAQKVFFPILKRLSPIKGDKSQLMADLAKPVRKLAQEFKTTNPGRFRALVATKSAAVLMAMVAGGAAWEYALTFAKNIFTAHAFKQDNFSSIANLSEQVLAEPGESKTVQKAKQRITAALGVGAGIAGVGMLIGSRGHQAKRLTPALENFLKVFDFNYRPHGKKPNQWITGLSQNLNRFFIANALVAYVDAARDKLERVEVASRLLVVLSYLAFGNELVTRWGVHLFNKKYPDLFKPMRDDLGNLVTRKGKVQLEVKKLEELRKLGKATFIKKLPAKNLIFWFPQLVGIGIAGFANAGVNVWWTKKRYDKEEAQNQKPRPTSQQQGAPLALPFTNKTTATQFRLPPTMQSATRQPMTNPFLVPSTLSPFYRMLTINSPQWQTPHWSPAQR